MKSLPTFAFVAVATITATLGLFALSETGPDAPQIRETSALVERGRYLAHQVGVCVDCHSPRKDGAFIEDKHLTGTVLPFAATVPMPWSPAAPNIAGLPATYKPEDMIRFLMTGERPNGLPPALPPMPGYRLDRADAEAITAYLVSLAPKQQQ